MTFTPTIFSHVNMLISSAHLQTLLSKASNNIVSFALSDFDAAANLYRSTGSQITFLPPETLLSAYFIGLITDRLTNLDHQVSPTAIISSFLSYIPSQPNALHDRVANLLMLSSLLDRYRDMRSVLNVCQRLRVVSRDA